MTRGKGAAFSTGSGYFVRKLIEEAVSSGGEARLLAEFDHPHVLPVFHAGEDEGLPYITMRLAEGGSLRGLIGRRLLPGHALRLLSQVADALDALHRRNVVHLDVKPENILLEGPAGDERVWLADLGLARSVCWSAVRRCGSPARRHCGSCSNARWPMIPANATRRPAPYSTTRAPH